MSDDGSGDDWEALEDAGTFDAEAEEQLARKKQEEEARFKAQADHTVRAEAQRKEQARQQHEYELREAAKEEARLAKIRAMEQDAMERRNTNDPLPQTQPIFKILKRDPKNERSQQQSEQHRKAAAAQQAQLSNKTLAEKQAEYAAARARIMGSHDTPDAASNPKREVKKKDDSANPLIRAPVGPDGTKGFARRRASDPTTTMAS